MRRNLVITISLVVIVILAVTLGLVFGLKGKDDETGRRFEVDYVGNQFLLDGEPFRYVAGSFHYFRAMPGAWAERLRTMRAAGLNAVDTYVEWSLHNPHDGVYNWEGIADLVKFIELATAEGFYIILRPGPYICAERDNGGVPHWLFTKYPSIRLRTSDPNYLKEVRTWYEKLMPQLGNYMYGNGGNIIMVQVENEYGVFDACDYDYTAWLRDETEKYVQGKALLFTTDIPNERSLKCGKIEGVFATTDFGIDRIYEVENIWRMLREVQPNGPLVNSEFYPGWLTHWQEENQRRDGQLVADALRTMLQQGASVNFYMFFGGTNFGFTAGANDFGYNKYVPDITSYDYDAVMDEAGAVTPKFNLVRNVITEFFGAPTVQPFTPAKRLSYGEVQLQPIVSMLSTNGRQMLAEGTPKTDTHPLSFEELDQYSGLVLYETTLPALEVDPTLLTIEGLHDRAFVYVDDQFVGTLSRENRIYSLPLHNGWGSNLQLLVENQGRINFNLANDTKGIFGDITVQKLDGSPQLLTNWKTTAFPLDEAKINALVEKVKAEGALDTFKHETILRHGPIVYHGEFTISEVGDTYLNTVGWGKGVLYVNGFNLGRYWPLAGPQLTLYVPNQLLKVGVNTVVMVEYQRANKQQNTDTYVVSMDNEAQLDA